MSIIQFIILYIQFSYTSKHTESLFQKVFKCSQIVDLTVSKLSPFQSINSIVNGKNEFLKSIVLVNGTESWHVFG